MQTIENEILVAADNTQQNQVPASAGNYEPVRFNAMKHGILSRHAVLPYEDKTEFEDLLTALKLEHQPQGMTELHLIEELATILWRKRRILQAEGALINRGVWGVAHEQQNKSTVRASVPLEMGMSYDTYDLPELLTANSDEIAERHKNAELDFAATKKASAILRKGGEKAYERARRALIPETRDWWDSMVEDEEYTGNAEGLEKFIDETLYSICARNEKETRYQSEIKAQTLGEGLKPHQLEKLNRYEVHLDRKFERCLAMLLKMKELRNR